MTDRVFRITGWLLLGANAAMAVKAALSCDPGWAVAHVVTAVVIGLVLIVRAMGSLQSQVERLQQDCWEAYQVVGVLATRQLDPSFAPIAEHEFDRVLDNLSAAVDGRPRPHEELLPWPRWAAVSKRGPG